MRLLRSIFLFLFCLSFAPAEAQNGNASAAIEIPNLAYFGTTSLGYYVHMQGNTSPGDGGDAYFYRSGLVCTVDGLNTLKDKSGNCFFRLQKNQAAISPLAFGAKCDGVTDDADALQATENAAGTMHVGIVYPSVNQQGVSALCKAVAHTLTPSIGVDHFCQMGMNSGGGGSYVSNGACGVTYNGVTGNAIWELNNANGTSGIQAPTWHDMYMTSSKGCIKLNDPNNGFTDDGTSQNYMLYPHADRVTCQANGIGFYCGKCFYGSVNSGQWNGSVSIRYEGSDLMEIRDNDLLSFTTLNIDLIQRNTFGNTDIVSGNFVSCSNKQDGSAIACIQTSARHAVIEHNEIECTNNLSNMQGIINVLSPAIAVVVNANTLSCTSGAAQFGLRVQADVPYIQFTNNITPGVAFPSAKFNTNNDTLLFPSSIQTQLVHFGNSNEAGFPFTTYTNFPETDALSPNVLFSAAPGSSTYNVDLGASAYAASVRISGGAYILPAAGGGGNVLVFDSVPAQYKGTLNSCIRASSVTAGQQIKLITKDAGVTVDTGVITVNTSPNWYCRTGIVVATNATLAVVADDTVHNGSVAVYRVTIGQ